MRGAPIISEVESTGSFQHILRQIDTGLVADAWGTPLDAVAAILVAVPLSLALWAAITVVTIA